MSACKLSFLIRKSCRAASAAGSFLPRQSIIITAGYGGQRYSKHQNQKQIKHNRNGHVNQISLEIVRFALLFFPAERPYKHHDNVHTRNQHDQHGNQPLAHSYRFFQLLQRPVRILLSAVVLVVIAVIAVLIHFLSLLVNGIFLSFSITYFTSKRGNYSDFRMRNLPEAIVPIISVVFDENVP